MPKLTTDEARELAREYYDLAGTLGAFRFDNWTSATPAQRAELESLEWSLLTQSSDMTSRAIDLATTDMRGSLKEISRATKSMTRAVKRISDVKKAMNVAAKALTLGSAIFTGNADAIAHAVTSAMAAIDNA